MANRNDKWIGHWDNSYLSSTTNKRVHGRGSYPDEVYLSIPRDIISLLEITEKDLVADIGGSTGDFSKIILEKCKPRYLELFEPSEFSSGIFKEWIEQKELSNVKATRSCLPEINFSTKFNKMFSGAVFMYLNSIEDVELSIRKMYDALEENGKALVFHMYDKDTWLTGLWDLMLISYADLESISKRVGFKSIERVTVGDYWGEDCTGKSELSVLLTK